MRELNGNTRIRLSQILDFKYWLNGLVEDAHKYEIGEISKKTGLQKCLVNGRIVWLLPSQFQGFNNGRLTDNDLNTLLKSCKKARQSPNYAPKKPTVQEALNCYSDMKNDWNNNPVICPFLNGAKIRLDAASDEHFTKTKGKPRPPNDIIRRGYLLTYVRDILERSGKPAEHIKNNNKESFSIVGKGNIKGIDKGIKVVITRKNKGKYYYFSVMDIQII